MSTGAAWTVDVPTEADREAIGVGLFAACSAETIRYRFFGMRNHFPARYLDAVIAGRPDVHDALVARDDRGDVIALGSLVTGEQPAELGLLVADAWQRHRIGSTLFELLLDRARKNGVEWVAASVLAERRHILDLMRTEATPVRTVLDHGVLEVVYRLHDGIRPEGS